MVSGGTLQREKPQNGGTTSKMYPIFLLVPPSVPPLSLGCQNTAIDCIDF